MKSIPLSNSPVSPLVDDADYEALKDYRWYLDKWGYVRTATYSRTTTKSGTLLMHRMIMRYPKGLHVHHKNGVRHDNRKENLEVITNAEHQKYHPPKPGQRGKNRITASKFVGVNAAKGPGSPWRARIVTGGKVTELGRFANEEDAARAYNRAALAHYGEKATLNPV
jgi:HNH endonuclease